MALTRDVLVLLAQMRVEIAATVDAATRDLTVAWARGWDALQTEWLDVVDDLTATGDTWPDRATLARSVRLLAAIDATSAALDRLAAASAIRVSEQLPLIASDAQTWAARITAAQMPTVAGSQVDLVAAFSRLGAAPLTAITNRVTQQITALHYPISAAATDAIRAELYRGIALGTNPRQAARRMVDRVEGRFNGGLGRAINIARTEMLDAHRDAQAATDASNANVLAGWTWLATLDPRTCVSCLAQHGSIHPLAEAGPIDHQSGRCARGSVTKSWRELGFDLDDPPSAVPDARAWFDALPQGTQAEIMGPERLARLRAGRVTWEDLSTRRTTAGWRDSMAPTPLGQLPERTPTPA